MSRKGKEKKKKRGGDRERPPFSLKGLCFLGLKTQSREYALTDMLFSVKTLSARLGLIPLYCGLSLCVGVCGCKRVQGGLFYLRKDDGGTQTEQ